MADPERAARLAARAEAKKAERAASGELSEGEKIRKEAEEKAKKKAQAQAMAVCQAVHVPGISERAFS